MIGENGGDVTQEGNEKEPSLPYMLWHHRLFCFYFALACYQFSAYKLLGRTRGSNPHV